MFAVYEATKITLKPPQTLIKNLLGHDLGALNATKWPHNNPHITHNAVKIQEKRDTKTVNKMWMCFIKCNMTIGHFAWDICNGHVSWQSSKQHSVGDFNIWYTKARKTFQWQI